MSNKNINSTLQKHRTYILSSFEIICFFVTLIFMSDVTFRQKYTMLVPAIIFFIIGCIIFIGDMIYHRIIKYYTFNIVGKTFVYDKLPMREDKVVEKYKKHYTYHIDKRTITQIKDYKLFKIIYGKIHKRTMWGKEVKESTYLTKIVIPYYISNGALKHMN